MQILEDIECKAVKRPSPLKFEPAAEKRVVGPTKEGQYANARSDQSGWFAVGDAEEPHRADQDRDSQPFMTPSIKCRSRLTTVTERLFGHGMLVSLAEQGLVSVSNFIGVIILAKALSPHDFGLYTLANTTSLLVAGVCSSLVIIPMRIFGSTAREAPQYFENQFALNAVIALCSGLLGAVLLTYLGLPLWSAAGLAWAAFVVLTQMQEFVRARHGTCSDWRHLLQMSAIGSLGRICFLVGFFSLFGLSLASAFTIGALSAGLAVFLGVRRWLSGRHIKIEWTRWLENWKFAKWLFLESCAYSLSTQLYFYVVAQHIDVESAGGLGAVQTLVGTMNVVFFAAANYSTSVARRRLLNEGIDRWRQCLYGMAAMLVAFSLLVTLVITLFAEDLLEVLFGHSYTQYAAIVPILGSAMILTAVTSAFSVAFRTVEMPQVGFWGKCLSAIITMVLAVPLIEHTGVVGAAIGFVITQLAWITVYIAEGWLRGRLSDEHLTKWVASRDLD